VFDKGYTNKLDNLVKEKFPIIYDYKFNGIVLLYGGALKDVIIKRITKDLDLLVITEDINEIINFIKKYKLSYSRTAFGGYKINYNNFIIDIFVTSDLYDAAVYDIDMLFYDINNHQIISCGAIDAITNKRITEINNTKPPLFTDELRLKKLKYFIQYITNSKYIKVYENKLLFKLKIFIKKINFNLNKIFNDGLIHCLKFTYNFKKYFVLNVILKILSSLISIILSIILGFIIINYNLNNILLFIFIIFLKILQITVDFITNKLELKMNKLMCINMNSEIGKFILKLRTYDSGNYNINKIVELFNLNINSYIKLFNIFLINIYIYCLDYRFGIILSLFMFVIYYLLKKKYRIDGKSNLKYYRYNNYDNNANDGANMNCIDNNIKKKKYDEIIDIVCSITYLILILFALYLMLPELAVNSTNTIL